MKFALTNLIFLGTAIAGPAGPYGNGNVQSPMMVVAGPPQGMKTVPGSVRIDGTTTSVTRGVTQQPAALEAVKQESKLEKVGSIAKESIVPVGILATALAATWGAYSWVISPAVKRVRFGPEACSHQNRNPGEPCSYKHCQRVGCRCAEGSCKCDRRVRDDKGKPTDKLIPEEDSPCPCRSKEAVKEEKRKAKEQEKLQPKRTKQQKKDDEKLAKEQKKLADEEKKEQARIEKEKKDADIEAAKRQKEADKEAEKARIAADKEQKAADAQADKDKKEAAKKAAEAKKEADDKAEKARIAADKEQKEAAKKAAKAEKEADDERKKEQARLDNEKAEQKEAAEAEGVRELEKQQMEIAQEIAAKKRLLEAKKQEENKLAQPAGGAQPAPGYDNQ